MRDWIRDRPTLLALLALLAPLLFSSAGFGVVQIVPALHGAAVRPTARQTAAERSIIVPTLPAPAPQEVVPPGRTQLRLPILEYHYVRVNPDPRDRLGFNLSVTPTLIAATGPAGSTRSSSPPCSRPATRARRRSGRARSTPGPTG